MKVLQVSQEISQTLGGSFESKFIYWSLLKEILLHLNDVIQCRARSVLRKYADATISTTFCNCYGEQDGLTPFTHLKRTL